MSLPHGFDSSKEVHNLSSIVGYTKCMADILDALKATDDPFILKDSLRLMIYATNDELMKLKNMDEINDILDNLTKSIPL